MILLLFQSTYTSVSIPANAFSDEDRNTGSECHVPETALVQVSGTSEWPNSGALSSLHPSGSIEQGDFLPFDPLSPWLPGPGILLVLPPLGPLSSLLLLPPLAPMHSSRAQKPPDTSVSASGPKYVPSLILSPQPILSLPITSVCD